MILQSLEAAIALTQDGYAVLQTLPRSSKILVDGWPDLLLTLDQLPQYFNGADQNISINWNKSGGRSALDLDVIEAEELAPWLLPRDTPAFGRNGRLRQLVFDCPDATYLSLKCDGEMFVEVLAGRHASLAPGSTHSNGDRVEWCVGRTSSDFPPKKVAAKRLHRFAHIMGGAAALLRHWREVAGQGVRHDIALSLAGAMLHAGWPPAVVRKVLRSVVLVAADPELKDRIAAIETTIARQQTGQPFSGLPELSKVLPAELTAALVRFWGLGRAEQEISNTTPGAPGGVPDEILLVYADTVPPEQIEWHWRGFLAAGKLSLLAGDPGVGKSSISSGVTANYTTGAPFPGSTEHRPPKRVLVAAAEDGAADTKVPRLIAAGADLSKVAFMDLVQTGNRQRYFTLADIEPLDALLSKNSGEFGLLVIDPVGGYLGGRDSHRDSDVRELLRPLAVLAEKHGIAVLLIAHLNKSAMHSAMNRVTGSGAFVAAARLPWLIAKDPHDPDTRLMVQLKSNLTEPLDGLSYHVEKALLADGAEASRIVWHDLPVKLTADEILQMQSEKKAPGRQEAERWLQQRLAPGPVAVRVLKEEAELQPFSWDTIKRAAKELGIRGEGEKKDRVWILPGQVQGTVVNVDFGGPKPNAAESEAHKTAAADTEVPAAAPASLDEVPIVKE